ncbi:VCBS repeat-containing protein [Myxococcus stipitatus]|uniref:FG-GAP repeat domain-containing protein n=1 Tax=Myxococcus stipitatus TaxID=83455 RepID=UPI0030CC2E0E
MPRFQALLLSCCVGLACTSYTISPRTFGVARWQGFASERVSLAAGGGQARGLHVADVDGDGVRDLVAVAAREERVCIHHGLGDGAFAPPRCLPAGTTPMDVAVSDVNGDGHQDLLIVGHFSNAMTVRLGDGRGGFREGTPYSLGNHSQQVRVADLDGDGHLDAITKNAGSGGFFNITTLKGRGDGTFSAAVPHPVTGLPRDLMLADVSADGLPDVLVLNTNSFTVDILLARKDGSLASIPPLRLTGSVDDEPFRLAPVDVNGDGLLDLVISHGLSGAGYLSVHLGDGTGGFLPSKAVPAEEPGEVVVADFNQDGRVDVAHAGLSGGVYLLLGQEGGELGPAVRVAATPTPTSLVAEDLDDDGFPDLAWTTQDTVEVLLGSTVRGAP